MTELSYEITSISLMPTSFWFFWLCSWEFTGQVNMLGNMDIKGVASLTCPHLSWGQRKVEALEAPLVNITLIE